MRYAVRYTNVDLLAAVVATGRPWRRWLATGRLPRSRSRPCASPSRGRTCTRLVASDNATVILVLDVSGSMQANDVKPTRLVAAQKATAHVPRQGAAAAARSASCCSRARPRSRRRRRPTTSSSREAIDEADFFRGFGGTAIGDAVALAVQVGLRSVGVQGDSVDAAAERARSPSYTPTAAKPESREHARLDPLPLRRPPDARHPHAAPGRREGARGRHPRLHRLARHDRQHDAAGASPAASPDPAAAAPAAASGSGGAGSAPDPKTLKAIADEDRRQVLPGEVGGSGRGRVSLARLQARPEAGHDRGHRSVPRGRCRAPRARRRALLALGAAAALGEDS